MRLHWFREHKQLVYYIICPLIVISMSVFGVASCRGSIFGVSGPAISYVVGGKEFYLSPQEVLQRRIILFKEFGGYDPHDKRVDRNPTTDNIGLLEAEVETARQQNFELGFEEFQEILRRDIKAKIQSIDRAKEGDPLPPLTRELYEKAALPNGHFGWPVRGADAQAGTAREIP